MDGGILGGLVIVTIERIRRIRLTGDQLDVVVARFGCLQLAGFRLLEACGSIGFLFAETLVEGVSMIFVDVVQPS